MMTLVIAVGNILCGDDGVANHIIEEVKKLPLPPNLSIFSVGTDPFSLFAQDLAVPEQIIVVDGIRSGGQTGDLYFIPAKELKPQPRPYSIHDITWYEILRMGGFLAKTCLFAVETDTLNTGAELSPVLRGKLEYYAAKLYECIVEQ